MQLFYLFNFRFYNFMIYYEFIRECIIATYSYLIGIMFKNTLIGFRPETFFAIKIDTIMFTTCIAVFITTMLSFGMPSEIIIKADTPSVAANPIYVTRNCVILLLLLFVRLYNIKKCFNNNNKINFKHVIVH